MEQRRRSQPKTRKRKRAHTRLLHNQQTTQGEPKFDHEGSANTRKDLISTLPDEILCSILSHLPLREGVRTFVLAKRWRDVYWNSVSRLEFDADNIEGCVNQGLRRTFKNLNHDKFVGCVNQVLRRIPENGRIESFKIQCFLGSQYSLEIDRWLQFAAASKALLSLDIDLDKEDSSCDHIFIPSKKNRYRIPSWVFEGRLLSSLKELSLACCRFMIPATATTCFSSLTSLTLTSMHLNQDKMEKMLSNCPNLSSVTLRRCVFTTHMELISRRYQCLALKHLTLINCYGLDVLQVYDATRLLSIECIGTCLKQLTLQNTAQPVTLCYWNKWVSTFGVPEFTKMEKLIFTSPYRRRVAQMPSQLTTLSGLRELVLVLKTTFVRVLLKWISSFLKASPYLQKLQVMLPYIIKKSWGDKTFLELRESLGLHEHLKEVELYQFDGKPFELKLVEYMLKHTKALEEVRVHRHIRDYRGHGQWFWERTDAITRQQLCKIIENLVSSTVGSTNIRLLVL